MKFGIRATRNTHEVFFILIVPVEVFTFRAYLMISWGVIVYRLFSLPLFEIIFGSMPLDGISLLTCELPTVLGTKDMRVMLRRWAF
jgi:hypothetical protein